jgi:hypothetical protein
MLTCTFGYSKPSRDYNFKKPSNHRKELLNWDSSLWVLNFLYIFSDIFMKNFSFYGFALRTLGLSLAPAFVEFHCA